MFLYLIIILYIIAIFLKSIKDMLYFKKSNKKNHGEYNKENQQQS